MIVPIAEFQLLIVRADPFPDRVRLQKIKRCSRNGRQRSNRNQPRINGNCPRAVNGQHVSKNVAAAFAAKIEIGMLSQIDRRRFVRGGLVLDFHRVIILQPIRDHDGKVSRIAFFAVFAHIAQSQPWGVIHQAGLRRPKHFIESDFAAVEMTWNAVRRIVRSQRVRGAIESETPVRDSVSKASHHRTEVRRPLDIVFNRIVAEDDVLEPTRAIRGAKTHNNRPVVRDVCLHPVRIHEGKQRCFSTIGQCAEMGEGDRGDSGAWRGRHEEGITISVLGGLRQVLSKIREKIFPAGKEEGSAASFPAFTPVLRFVLLAVSLDTSLTLRPMANFAPSDPNSPAERSANVPVEPPMEEKLRIFWEKNSRAILGLCIVLLLAVLIRGAYNYYLREREATIQGDFAAASTPDKLRGFIEQHPDHALSGLALLQIADEAYSSGKYSDAQNSYHRAAGILKRGPFAGRARLGEAIAKIDGGDRTGEQDLKGIASDALELKPVRAEAAFHLATIAAAAGKNDEALKQLDFVTSLDQLSSWSQRAQMVRATLPGGSSIPAAPVAAPVVSVHP